MSRVNWAAKSSHEYVGNYKLLQKAFTKNKVQRYVDVDKLIRGKYQDNLEFCQWLKAFFDMQNGGGAGMREDYDAVAVRAKGKGGKMVGMNKGGGAGNAGSSRARAPVRSSSSVSASSGRSGNNAPVVGKARIGSSASSSTTSSSSAARPATTSRSSPRKATTSSSASTTTSTARSARPTRERSAPTQKENNSATNLPTITRKPTPTTTTTTSSSSVSTAQVKKYQEEITTLKSQTTTLQTQVSELQVLSTELEMSINTVESERDFYFEKLRGIEVMLQVYKEKEESGEVVDGSGSGGGEMKMVIDKIFKVMYAAAEDNVVVDDEGNVNHRHASFFDHHSHASCHSFPSIKLVGDITIDDSVIRSNVSFGSIRPHAQDELINDEDNDDDDDELLTSGIVEPVEAHVAVEQVNNLVQLSDDDDDDDDELLTSGIISPVNEVLLTSDAVENVVLSANQHLQPDLDDDDDDDDELLTSGIVDSGDEELEDDATNRSAENARIISQLVGDNDDDISDEDLLADDASQDEY
eukprot:scaffold1933_cov145-Skeletonema_dohrnii-CCMP3373.AAC.5